MIHFKSTAAAPLSFDLGGRHYDVPVEGEVSIPRRYAYAVEKRRLSLVQTGESSAPAATDPGAPPADPVARLWYDRAHDMRATLERFQERRAEDDRAAGEDAREALEASDLLRSELAGVRARLGLSPEESILEALDMLLGAPPPPPPAKSPKTTPAAPKP